MKKILVITATFVVSFLIVNKVLNTVNEEGIAYAPNVIQGNEKDSNLITLEDVRYEVIEEKKKSGDKNIRITSYEGNSKHVTIPVKFEDEKGTKYYIKEIGVSAFEGERIESVTFSEGLEKIDNKAFANNKIKEVHRLDIKSLKEIGKAAFMNNKIKKIELYETEKIKDMAFYNNEMAEVDFGRRVEEVSDTAFKKNKVIRVKLAPMGIVIDVGDIFESGLITVTENECCEEK